jgi:hypothetical protein
MIPTRAVVFRYCVHGFETDGEPPHPSMIMLSLAGYHFDKLVDLHVQLLSGRERKDDGKRGTLPANRFAVTSKKSATYRGTLPANRKDAARCSAGLAFLGTWHAGQGILRERHRHAILRERHMRQQFVRGSEHSLKASGCQRFPHNWRPNTHTDIDARILSDQAHGLCVNFKRLTPVRTFRF